MNEFDDVLIQAAQQFPTKKERRQYALLQAAAIIYASSERVEDELEVAVENAEALLNQIEGLT